MPRPEFGPVPVIAKWLLDPDAECRIRGVELIVTSRRYSEEFRIDCWNFVELTGKLLWFRSPGGRLPAGYIEFARLGRDARYEIECADEARAELLAERVRSAIADLSPELLNLARKFGRWPEIAL
jgi:hypothetical protein